MSFFFFNDTAPPEIYTLSLHDALPIFCPFGNQFAPLSPPCAPAWAYGSSSPASFMGETLDRKSTRLNSSHANISYAVFCLKKKDAYRQGDSIDLRVLPVAVLGPGPGSE